MYHGTAFVAQAADQRAFSNRIELEFLPGTPTDTAFAESFNGRVRAEFLNPSYFETLYQARRAAGIGGMTTMKFVRNQCWGTPATRP